jgi:beta-N-acetylhexosaminidase
MVIVRWGGLLVLAALVGTLFTVVVRRPAAAPAAGAPEPATLHEVMAALTPEQRVGQLFMAGLRSDAPAEEIAVTEAAIRDLHAGNLVLYGTGWNSRAKIAATVVPLQALARRANGGVGLFVSGNQEGGSEGSFQAFYGDGFTPIPSARRQAEGDPQQLEADAARWGRELRAAGVNLNLAPVLDVVPAALGARNDPIGRWQRDYGATPEVVTTYGLAFARGMRAAPVAVAVKHFPGLGRVTGNTDFTVEGIVDDTFTGADDPDLAPFRAAIADGVEFVMVSLAVYPRVDSRQAVFSPVILRELLRDQLGFPHVIISDDVGAAVAVADRPPAERAPAFFRAGGDMLLTVQASDIRPMTRAVLEAAAGDAAFRADLDAAVARVLALKRRYGLLPTGSQ